MEYNFDENINRLGTYCTQWDYVQDRFGVPDLLPFTISDMDFAVAPTVLDAVKQRIDHPIYGYSRWRNDEYLSSIVGWYKKRFSTEIQKEWIYYSPSVMYSVAKMIQLLSDPGDGVTLMIPAYDAFFNVIKNNQRKIVRCILQESVDGYQINYEELEKCLKKSRILLLCNPHNPVGRVWTRNELDKIAELCKQTDTVVISDDIHMDIVFKGEFQPFLYDGVKSVICTSPSKAFNTPSLGGSYVIIPDLVLGTAFEQITRYTEFVNSPSILGIVSTIAAYDSEDWLDELLQYIKGNIAYSMEYIKDNMPDWEVYEPEGCYFLWISTKRQNVSDADLQKAFVDIGKVAVMSGNVYEGEHHLRFHIGCPRNKVKEGLQRMKKSYDWLKQQSSQ